MTDGQVGGGALIGSTGLAGIFSLLTGQFLSALAWFAGAALILWIVWKLTRSKPEDDDDDDDDGKNAKKKKPKKDDDDDDDGDDDVIAQLVAAEKRRQKEEKRRLARMEELKKLFTS